MLRCFVTASIFGALCASLTIGCSSSSNPCPGAPAGTTDCDAFDTYQACFDEHTMNEGFDPACAVEICCIDHPIGGTAPDMVCGETASTCQTYVSANLVDAADTMLSTDITNACNFYVVDSGRTTGTGSTCGS
ncbi:MAG TPA: hypothetical protein VGF94_24780 [Kofleriaceae bacterium]|jgi:hypothetical protein